MYASYLIPISKILCWWNYEQQECGDAFFLFIAMDHIIVHEMAHPSTNGQTVET